MQQVKIFFFIPFTLMFFISGASHIRAGEVVAKRISGLTYEFTFIGYRDVDGVLFGNGIFDFGDGATFGGENQNESIPWETPVSLGNGVDKWQFSLTYTYTGGANYLVSYSEDFRNDDIQNIAGSISTSFYVETLVVVDQLISNSTPIFTVPPIDEGVVGSLFEHNPGAFDLDGDSLSYYFTNPKQSKGLDVNGYQSLINPAFYTNFGNGNSSKTGQPILSIDPVTGTLVWDAPGGATIPDMENREFNVAFIVEEWRRINGRLIRLGYVTRDMQIIVWNYDNDPPEIEIPKDTCVVAGSTINAIITGIDPDGDPVKLEAFGGAFEIIPPATFNPRPPDFQNPPAILNFEWITTCAAVRNKPYDLQFKATDLPTIPLSSNPTGQSGFETWRITIVGPPPEGLALDVQPGRKISLKWNSYSCSNADSMQVWRRVGEFEIDPSCNTGIPENSDYELIQTQSISDTTFIDNNNELGLSPGSKYCYRLVATFPMPLGGVSIASEEVCDSLIIDTPIITNVDIKSTGETDGKIRISWTPPYEIDPVVFPPTYTYGLIRTDLVDADGSFVSVATTADTTFLDTGLNTKDISYSYRILLFDNTDQLVDTSQQASSVRLLPAPQVGSIQLNWSANVPWSNSVQEFPYHYVYRDNVLTNFPDSLILIDSTEVTVDGLSYLDNGRFNNVELEEEIEYCYFVTTQGSYGNALLPEPLINNSQIICAQPNDIIPPCPPISISFDSNFKCENQVSCGENIQLRNVLNWEFDREERCDNDILFFRVYFSESDSDDESLFKVLGETSRKQFFHEEINSLAFCYYVTSVDRSGNESQISEIICNDNCSQYILPNVITLNGDGKNDVFRPFQDRGKCPRFVEFVEFKVLSRTGVELFTHDSTNPEKTIFINWDGKTNGGKELPAGVYFYSARVKFKKLNPANSVEIINGWVQIIR